MGRLLRLAGFNAITKLYIVKISVLPAHQRKKYNVENARKRCIKNANKLYLNSSSFLFMSYIKKAILYNK